MDALQNKKVPTTIKIALCALFLLGVGVHSAEAFRWTNTPELTGVAGGDVFMRVASTTNPWSYGSIGALQVFIGATTDVSVRYTLFEGDNESNHVDCSSGLVTISSIGGYVGPDPFDFENLTLATIPMTGTECALDANTGGFDEDATGSEVVGAGSSTPSVWARVSAFGEVLNGGVEYVPTIPIAKNIEILDPTYGTTTATTTFNVRIKYKTPFSLDYRPTTTRFFVITDAVTNEVNYTYSEILEAGGGENVTINITATTTEGSKFIQAMYLSQNGGIYSEVDEVFFNVATNTYFQATGLLTPRDSPSGLNQINCDLFDVGCQFQKAIAFMFIPKPDTLDKFTNLWQTISNKRPFGYFTVIMSQLEELSADGTPAFSLGSLPFMDAIFTPIRGLLAVILWGLFGMWFYRNHLVKMDI